MPKPGDAQSYLPEGNLDETNQFGCRKVTPAVDSPVGANFRASKGEARRGYGAARGAVKSPVVARSPDVEKNDKVLFIDAGGGDV